MCTETPLEYKNDESKTMQIKVQPVMQPVIATEDEDGNIKTVQKIAHPITIEERKNNILRPIIAMEEDNDYSETMQEIAHSTLQPLVVVEEANNYRGPIKGITHLKVLPIVATEEDEESGDSKANQEIKSPVIQPVIIMKEDSKERRDIAQPIVHNIFGTNGEDDYSVHDMLNNHQPMAEIGSTYAIPIATKDERVKEQEIRQPIVHNIFGTNAEDDYSVHDMLNNHQPMADIGSTYAIPIATKDGREKKQKIRQPIVQNIFGTNDEDDDSVNDMLNNYQPMAEIGEGSTYTGTYTIPIATKNERKKKQEIIQPMVPNIFGTEDEDGDNICEMLNNYQPMAEMGAGSTYAIPVGIHIETDGKLREEEFTSILKKVSSFSVLNDAANPDSSFHRKKKSVGMRRTASTVSFKAVEIREYDRAIGDNPSCSSGPPIALDWNYSENPAVCINEYEEKKVPRKNGPKHLNRSHRESLLKETLGYTEEEINDAKNEAKKTKKQRSRTDMISPFWRLEHAVQSVKRKISRRKSKKKKNISDELDFSSSSRKSTTSAQSNTSMLSELSAEDEEDDGIMF